MRDILSLPLSCLLPYGDIASITQMITRKFRILSQSMENRNKCAAFAKFNLCRASFKVTHNILLVRISG